MNFFEYGMQNSRGFRALKVWMALQQVGREGYVDLMRQDIALADRLYRAAEAHPELQAMTRNLSIATLRYLPPGFEGSDPSQDEYLNTLNQDLLNTLQVGGDAFLSNAVEEGRYALRACIVNFRTTDQDIDRTVELIVREGRKAHARLSNG